MVSSDDDNSSKGQQRTTGAQTPVRRGASASELAPTLPRRRRYWWPRWQGVARFGLLIGLVAFATVVFSGVRERRAPPVARVIDRLDPEAIIETIDCEHAQNVGDQQNFALSGGLCSTYEGGSMRTKDKLEQAREAWDYRARKEGYRCITCGAHIVYGDRDVYFMTGGLETGMCGSCAHQIRKDD